MADLGHPSDPQLVRARHDLLPVAAQQHDGGGPLCPDREAVPFFCLWAGPDVRLRLFLSASSPTLEWTVVVSRSTLDHRHPHSGTGRPGWGRPTLAGPEVGAFSAGREIGRASCRERV